MALVEVTDLKARAERTSKSGLPVSVSSPGVVMNPVSLTDFTSNCRRHGPLLCTASDSNCLRPQLSRCRDCPRTPSKCTMSPTLKEWAVTVFITVDGHRLEPSGQER